MKRYLVDVILGISVIGFFIFSYSYLQEHKEIKETTIAIEKVQTKIDNLMIEPVEEISKTNGVVQIIPKYKSLYEINNDLIGFIYVDGQHKFPILQKIDNQNYYLSHDYFGDESSSGSIFANAHCHLGEPGVTLIYGHHIKGNQMFSCLDAFMDKNFFESAEPIQIDTLYEENLYQVAAVALCNLNDSFKYYEYIGDLSEGKFELWKYCMSEKILWGSIKDLSFKDTIIELSTCNYENEDNRLVVILIKTETLNK